MRYRAGVLGSRALNRSYKCINLTCGNLQKPCNNMELHVFALRVMWSWHFLTELYPTGFTFFSFITLFRISHSFPPKPWRATPYRSLSLLTSHLIPSRPISSLLICSSNHNHHTHTHTHTHTHMHTCTKLLHNHARLRPLVCLKPWALMILLLFTAL